MGASPMLLLVTSTVRTSSVSSSMPMCILRHMRRLQPPCLRTFHSPSPPALIPVLSMRRFSGPFDPRYRRLTFSVFWRRHKVLKSGTAQPEQLQQALDKPSCLPKRHPKQDLQRQTSLNGGITELLLATALAVWRRQPNHLWIKPDQQRSALLQAVIVRRPILGLVLRRGTTAHAFSYHDGFIH